jgi:hypothetical protein
LMEDLFNWYLSHNILRGLEHFPMTRPWINSEYGCVTGAVSSSRGQCSLHISMILLAYFRRRLLLHALYTVRYFILFYLFLSLNSSLYYGPIKCSWWAGLVCIPPPVRGVQVPTL